MILCEKVRTPAALWPAGAACHMRAMSDAFRSQCPIVRALDIVGDRWSLVVLRSLLPGWRRYADLLKDPEGISTNILADRLSQLLETGMIERRLYQERPQRYEYALTRKGADFLPVLQALAAWSGKYIDGCLTPSPRFVNGKPEDFLPKASRAREPAIPPQGTR